MKREYGYEQIVHDGTSVVTVGTLDGVHLGHQAILRYVISRARARGGTSVAVTFEPHPREVVHGEAVPLLTTVEERAEVLDGLGLDRFIVLPFTPEFARMPPEEFVRGVLVERIGLQEVVIGYDHGFGRGRAGDSRLLEALGGELGFEVDVIPAQVVEEHVVSSTEIRRLLVEEGDVVLAAHMLGRRYSLVGTVTRGDGRGRTIGFPTANLAVEHPRKVVPKEGVYAVEVTLPGGSVCGGMLNIGRRPTFDGTGIRLEVHLFDFDGDLYGQALRLAFAGRLRDEQRFSSVEALVAQLGRDRARSREVLAGA